MTHAAHLLNAAGRAECKTNRAVWGFSFGEYHQLVVNGSDGHLHACERCRAGYQRRLAKVLAARAAKANA